MFAGLVEAELGSYQTGNPELQSFFSLTLRIDYSDTVSQFSHHITATASHRSNINLLNLVGLY